MLSTALVALIVLVAAFIQGTSGFGFAFFGLPLCALLLDFKVAVVNLVILAQGLNLLILWQHHFRAEWRSVMPLALTSLPGIPVGVWLLRILPVYWLQGTLGVLLVAFALYRWRANPVPRVLGRLWILVAGFIAGILGGAMNSQGPPILVFVSLQPWDKDRVKATVVGFFAVTGVAILGTQAAQGLVTAEVLRLSAICLPLMVLGVLAGRKLYLRLGEGGYRKVFTALLFALGVMMIVKSVATWLALT